MGLKTKIDFHFTQISFKLFWGAIDVRSAGNQLELRMKAKYRHIFSAIFQIKFIPKFQNFCSEI
jgi:hypothetical protein